MQKLVGDVLLAWREAERATLDASPGPEREAALQRVDELKSLYRLVTRAGDGPHLALYRSLLDEIRTAEPHLAR
jgi:hypothetical protein